MTAEPNHAWQDRQWAELWKNKDAPRQMPRDPGLRSLGPRFDSAIEAYTNAGDGKGGSAKTQNTAVDGVSAGDTSWEHVQPAEEPELSRPPVSVHRTPSERLYDMVRSLFFWLTDSSKVTDCEQMRTQSSQQSSYKGRIVALCWLSSLLPGPLIMSWLAPAIRVESRVTFGTSVIAHKGVKG